MKDAKRWRGLVALVRDTIEHTSRAVERVHLDTAERPFAILEKIPGVAQPTHIVHVVHDATVSGVHQIVRAVSRGVVTTVDLALRVAEQQADKDADHGS
jgi:hypothetical protein